MVGLLLLLLLHMLLHCQEASEAPTRASVCSSSRAPLGRARAHPHMCTVPACAPRLVAMRFATAGRGCSTVGKPLLPCDALPGKGASLVTRRLSSLIPSVPYAARVESAPAWSDAQPGIQGVTCPVTPSAVQHCSFSWPSATCFYCDTSV